MIKTFIRTIVIGSLATLALTGAALASSQNFHNPTVNGNRLDYCYTWGQGCGQQAADAFCVSKGFVNATGFTEAHDIGATSPTRLISTGAVCDQDFCDGFSNITCTKPDMATFNNPTINGSPLDYCVTWGADCGQAAADKFCQSKGLSHAVDFAEAHDIGAATPTRLIGTGAVCDQDFCDGFTFIDCE